MQTAEDAKNEAVGFRVWAFFCVSLRFASRSCAKAGVLTLCSLRLSLGTTL
jgi:hypothetical protein